MCQCVRIRYFKSQNVQPTQRDCFNQESIVPSVDAVVVAVGGAEDAMVACIYYLFADARG
jgi:hypothetical protein